MVLFLENVLKSKWRSLRQGYSKCLQKRNENTRSGAAAKPDAQCQYFESLGFLKDSMTKSSTVSNISVPFSHHTATSHSTTPLSSRATPDGRSITGVSHGGARGGRKRPAVDQLVTASPASMTTSDATDALLLQTLARMDSPQKVRPREDTDTLFCKSLVDTFKAFNDPKKKAYAKLKVQQVLYDIMFTDSD